MPPDSFFTLVRERDREAARKFYKKYMDVKGMPVVASGEVADAALQRIHYIVTHMLAGWPDVVAGMAKNGMYLISYEAVRGRFPSFRQLKKSLEVPGSLRSPRLIRVRNRFLANDLHGILEVARFPETGDLPAKVCPKIACEY